MYMYVSRDKDFCFFLINKMKERSPLLLSKIILESNLLKHAELFI